MKKFFSSYICRKRAPIRDWYKWFDHITI